MGRAMKHTALKRARYTRILDALNSALDNADATVYDIFREVVAAARDDLSEILVTNHRSDTEDTGISSESDTD